MLAYIPSTKKSSYYSHTRTHSREQRSHHVFLACESPLVNPKHCVFRKCISNDVKRWHSTSFFAVWNNTVVQTLKLDKSYGCIVRMKKVMFFFVKDHWTTKNVLSNCQVASTEQVRTPQNANGRTFEFNVVSYLKWFRYSMNSRLSCARN
jgi:hypothetical protein